MARLPSPRGPATEFLFDRLTGKPALLGAAPAPIDEPLAGEDFALALYVLYELHYRGFEEVDDDWEWEPSLLAFRARLERSFERCLREAVGNEQVAGEDVAARLATVLSEAPDSGFGRYMERHATLEQFRAFVVHRSAYQLKENDPHAWAIPRLD